MHGDVVYIIVLLCDMRGPWATDRHRIEFTKLKF